MFEALDMLEAQLAGRDFLLGDAMTGVDIRLFVTLIRFDSVYHGHFKCNLRDRQLSQPLALHAGDVPASSHSASTGLPAQSRFSRAISDSTQARSMRPLGLSVAMRVLLLPGCGSCRASARPGPRRRRGSARALPC